MVRHRNLAQSQPQRNNDQPSLLQEEMKLLFLIVAMIPLLVNLTRKIMTRNLTHSCLGDTYRCIPRF